MPFKLILCALCLFCSEGAGNERRVGLNKPLPHENPLFLSPYRNGGIPMNMPYESPFIPFPRQRQHTPTVLNGLSTEPTNDTRLNRFVRQA